jgi:hypothetical protein
MWIILMSKHLQQRITQMDNRLHHIDPVTGPAPTDLSDSIDLRFLVTGKLTPTAIPVRRDRAALTAALNRARSRAEAHSDSPIERISR